MQSETELSEYIFSDEQIGLMRRTIARGASEDELALFVEQCQRTGLDPFARQIYAVRRKQWNSATRQLEDQQVIQVSIDGFRLIADRTHKYAGQVGPWWCGPDGDWKEVWLSDNPPSAARVGVLRHDFLQPLYAVALYKSYVQTNSQGEPVSRWKTDPAGMTAKCAEALALRRAFPHQLSGLYTTEEMGQADNTQVATNGRSDSPAESTGIQPTQPTTTAEQREPVEETTTSQPAPRGKKSGSARPYLPADLQANYEKAVKKIEARGLLLGPDDYAITGSALSNLVNGAYDLERYLQFVTGSPTLEEMTEAQVVALLRLLKPIKAGGSWLPSEDAMTEAASVLAVLNEQSN